MSVQCPADGCDFTGHMDAVEGHIGGVSDPDHVGVVVPDLRASLSKGTNTRKIGLLVALVVGIFVLSQVASPAPGGAGSGRVEEDQR